MQDGVAKIYGFGIYDGDEIPPGDNVLNKASVPNPKVVLDDGGVVWGYQCWWGPCEDEEALRKRAVDQHWIKSPEDLTIEYIPPEED